MTLPTRFKGKKVLVLNLGLLGGGVATTHWLLKQGARVTVTDFADEKIMAPSVKRVEEYLRKSAVDGNAYKEIRARLSWSFGAHSPALVDAADTLVINPSVAVTHPYVQQAFTRKMRVENEGTLFYHHGKKKMVGVTGTRGKTTTASWTSHFIKGSVLTGNSYTKPFQTVMDARATAAVTELSSFILELFPWARVAPRIAVITNLYRDHLNRHGTMQEYARAKANIFMHQTATDHLILNQDNEWTPWFISQKPRGHVWCFSMAPLPAGVAGVWYADGALWEWKQDKEKIVLDIGDFGLKWGMHNVANLAAAALAAHLAGVPWVRIQSRIASVPVISFRQEVVYRDARLTVVNDTTATSPEGGIAALRRWGGPTCVLICGGTDRDLDYREWARELPKHVRATNTILLTGSATKKMRAALGEHSHGIRAYDSLEAAFKAARKRAGLYVSSVVLFSPAAKSFELFANEFDRGQQFNALVQRDLKGR